MNQFRQKYKGISLRLKCWDYGNAWAYFVTVCTRNRMPYFGHVQRAPDGNTIILSEVGRIVKEEWMKTPLLRPDMNLELGEFIVMPDHFHAIIIIGDNQYNSKNTSDPVYGWGCEKKIHRWGGQSKNLSSIMRGFKSAVTMAARNNGNTDFRWQSRFYERIIRNQREYRAVTNYIIKNPDKLK